MQPVKKSLVVLTKNSFSSKDTTNIWKQTELFVQDKTQLDPLKAFPFSGCYTHIHLGVQDKYVGEIFNS